MQLEVASQIPCVACRYILITVRDLKRIEAPEKQCFCFKYAEESYNESPEAEKIVIGGEWVMP